MDQARFEPEKTAGEQVSAAEIPVTVEDLLARMEWYEVQMARVGGLEVFSQLSLRTDYSGHMLLPGGTLPGADHAGLQRVEFHNLGQAREYIELNIRQLEGLSDFDALSHGEPKRVGP